MVPAATMSPAASDIFFLILCITFYFLCIILTKKMSLTMEKNGPAIAFVKEDKSKKVYVADAPATMPTVGGSIFTPPKHEGERAIIFKDELQPIPYRMKGQRSAVYVVGASGSGKSTFIANCIKTQPKKDVYLFTTATDMDPALEKIKRLKKVNYMKAKENIKYVTVDDLKDSICIFDDHDNSTDREINRILQTLVNSILENGRKLKIDMYVVSHNPRDFLRTRTLILECDSFVVFPQTNRVATVRFLKEYFDDDKNFLQKMKFLNDGGRFTFAMFHKNVPRYMVTKHSVQLLD